MSEAQAHDESRRQRDVLTAELLEGLDPGQFQAVAELAARVLEAPMAAVGLSDERTHTLVGAVGLRLGPIGRDRVLCDWVVTMGEGISAADASVDPRIADRAAICGLRAFCAQPLRLRGNLVGSLFVADSAPRPWSEAGQEALQYLVRVAEGLLAARRDEIDLRRHTQRLDAVFAALPDLLLRVDTEGVVREFVVPPGFPTSLPAEMVIGRHFGDLLGGAARSVCLPAVQRCLELRRVQTVEFSVEGPAGEQWREARLAPVGDGQVVALIRDITPQRSVERLRAELISTVSHELRTPLTAIQGSLGLLEGGVVGRLDQEAAELVHVAKEGADRLLRLVNDILDLERAEAGRMLMKLRPTGVRHAMEQVTRQIQSLADSSRVQLKIEGEGLVRADEERLLQILTNFLANAIRYSSAGDAVELAAAPRQGVLRLEVRDRGPGVSDERRERLFERFSQVDASDRRRGGTGLGLAICRALAVAMGGAVGYVPREGGGSVFWLELPAVAVAPEGKAPDAFAVRVAPVSLAAGDAELLASATSDEEIAAALREGPVTLVARGALPGWRWVGAQVLDHPQGLLRSLLGVGEP